MKNRVDLRTGDQIIYLFVPEMLAMKDEAERKDNVIRIFEIDQILSYVRTKVELDNFKVFDEFKNTKLIIPEPSEIIEGRSPKGIPNN